MFCHKDSSESKVLLCSKVTKTFDLFWPHYLFVIDNAIIDYAIISIISSISSSSNNMIMILTIVIISIIIIII